MKLLTPYPCNLPFLVSQKWNENPLDTDGKPFYPKIGMKGHNGWDLAVPVGTPVYSTIDGIVFYAQVDGADAKTVAIDTDCEYEYNSSTTKFQVLYTHLSKIMVEVGQRVVKGQLVGLSGNTGRYTTGPHLHYGIHPVVNSRSTYPANGYNGAVDPVHFFDGTYPSSPAKDKRAAAAFALRDWQVSVGIMDFAGETNPDIIRFGPESKKQFNKY